MEVSVVIPTFNYGRFLARALDSVVRQRHVVEVLVIDDGSTDETPAVIEAYLQESRSARELLRYRRQTNAGPSVARNHGVRLARAPWVAFLDADDYWYPGKLERQVAFAQRHPHAVLYFCGVDIEDSDGRRRRWLPPREGRVTWCDMVRENLVPSATPVVNREVLLEVGGFDENRRLSEDWDLWLRLTARGHLAAQRVALACYRDHAAGLHRDLGIIEAAWAVMSLALARRRLELDRRSAGEAMAGLLRSEAFARWAVGDMAGALRCARAAVRLDLGQAMSGVQILLRAIAKRFL